MTMSDAIKGLRMLLATAQHVVTVPTLSPAAKAERLADLREDAAHWLEFVDRYDEGEQQRCLAIVAAIDGVGIGLPSAQSRPRRFDGGRKRDV